MARDRLATFRAQQQLSSSTNQSPTLGSDNYELRNVNVDAAENDNMAAFYSDLQTLQNDLETYRGYVSNISELHSRSMSIADAETTEQGRAQLNDLSNKARSLSNDIKRRIDTLQKEKQTGTEGQIRNQQLAVISRKFVEAIQNHQQVEQQYRSKFKQRVERQFKIVKPDATPEELKLVVDEGGGAQIFAEALQSTTRYGDARMVYQEVQERQADIKKIEYTLAELAQLFNEMSMIIEKEGEVIDEVQRRAVGTTGDIEQGLRHTERAVKSARSARRKRWICFFISLLILAVLGVALGVGLGVGIPNHSGNNRGSSNGNG